MIPLITAILVGCGPPGCETVCARVVDECGLGHSTKLCEESCGGGAFAKNGELRACLHDAGCGQIAAGACLYADSPGPDYHVVSAPGCMDQPLSFLLDEESRTVTSDGGDWGSFGGPPTVSEGQFESFSVIFGECLLERPVYPHGQDLDGDGIPEEGGAGASDVWICPGCTVAEWQLF